MGENGYIVRMVAESLLCSPETVTTLVICSDPKQEKGCFFFFNGSVWSLGLLQS